VLKFVFNSLSVCNAIGTNLNDYVLLEDHFLQDKLCEFNVCDFDLHFDHIPIYLILKSNTKFDDSIDHTQT
jgi:hypothetical protein